MMKIQLEERIVVISEATQTFEAYKRSFGHNYKGIPVRAAKETMMLRDWKQIQRKRKAGDVA